MKTVEVTLFNYKVDEYSNAFVEWNEHVVTIQVGGDGTLFEYPREKVLKVKSSSINEAGLVNIYVSNVSDELLKDAEVGLLDARKMFNSPAYKVGDKVSAREFDRYGNPTWWSVYVVTAPTSSSGVYTVETENGETGFSVKEDDMRPWVEDVI
jgi:hypothetical protein